MIDLFHKYLGNGESLEKLLLKPQDVRRIESILQFNSYDDIEIMFKDLIQPDNEPYTNVENNVNFEVLRKYFSENGYELLIDEDPFFDFQPTTLSAFASHKIKGFLKSRKIIKPNGDVAWSDRRALIETFRFKSRLVQTSNDVQEILKKVSYGQLDPNNYDAYLGNICNGIEYLLFKGGKYLSISKFVLNHDPYSEIEILDDERLKKFRLKTQCFRHHKPEESVIEREQITRTEKKILIIYGVMILEFIVTHYDEIISSN